MPSSNHMIWEAVCATSAGPTFFKHIIIEGVLYVDSGMGCDKPVQQVLQEAKHVFPDRHVVTISIGAGQGQTTSIPKPGWFQWVLPFDVIDTIQKIATGCELSAQLAAQRLECTPAIYFCFNVE